MNKILLIDDNATHREINRQWIETLCPGQFEVIEAGDAAAGVSRILTESPACVLLDFIMPGEDGFQTLHRLTHDLPGCPPIIFLTCALTEDLKRNALALGAVSCFEKSQITGEEIVDAIRNAIERTGR